MVRIEIGLKMTSEFLCAALHIVQSTTLAIRYGFVHAVIA